MITPVVLVNACSRSRGPKGGLTKKPPLKTLVHNVSTLAEGTPLLISASFGETMDDNGPLSVASSTGFAPAGRSMVGLEK